MKIQIDFDNKTIKVEGTVELGQLFDKLQKLLPSEEWKTFKLETNTTIKYWNTPIVIDHWPVYPWRPNQPYWQVNLGDQAGSSFFQNDILNNGSSGRACANSVLNLDVQC